MPEQRVSHCSGPFTCVVYLGPLFGPVFVVGGGHRVLMGGGGCRVLMGDGRGRVLIGGGGGCVLTWSCHCVTVLLVVARVTCQLLKLFRLHAIYNAV